MRVIDYLQGEIRDVKEIKQLNNGEFQLTYNNEVVKRRKYEFRELDKVCRCIKEFVVEVCDGNGFPVDGEYTDIPKDSLWCYPEDKDYRITGGEIRLEHEQYGWIEISKEYFNEHFEIIAS